MHVFNLTKESTWKIRFLGNIIIKILTVSFFFNIDHLLKPPYQPPAIYKHELFFTHKNNHFCCGISKMVLRKTRMTEESSHKKIIRLQSAEIFNFLQIYIICIFMFFYSLADRPMKIKIWNRCS